MNEYDVIIIGAGPAGGSAALHSAQQGLKVLVLEEHSSIGEPVHCGECLSELAEERMGWEIPESVISERVKGIRVIFPDGSSNTLTEKGFVLEKHKFEQWIMDQAKEKGTEVKLSAKATDFVRENGKWIVKCADGSEYKCEVLIDASGSIALLSHKLGLNKRFEVVIGFQYELLDIPREGWIDFYLWPELAPHGYLWMIPKCDGRANVGLVTNEKLKAIKYTEEFLRKMGWEGKKKVKPLGGMIPAGGPVENTYSEGLLLVGDAAGFTSPLFEGGTQLGLMSGKFAAQVAEKAVGKNDFSRDAMKEYEALWKAEFPKYSSIIEGKNSLYNFTDQELNEISQMLPKELSTMNVLDKAAFGAKALIGHRQLLSKGLIPAMLAFGYSRAYHYGW